MNIIAVFVKKCFGKSLFFLISNVVLHENIRQLSGYVQNYSIRKKLSFAETDLYSLICPCLIVYPDKNGKNIQELEDQLYDEEIEVSDYLKFRCVGIRLPYLLKRFPARYIVEERVYDKMQYFIEHGGILSRFL